jgi:predicted ATP-grasp superfamily ATP-dependent carboligase
MPSDSPFLIVAASARQLAQSAAHSGHDVVVVDWFGDRDTCATARAVRRAVAADSLRFDPPALLAAADELAPPGACAGVVAGSGFEDAPRLLARLAAGRRLYGNDAATVEAVKDPARFFPLLDGLGIAHPEVSLECPAQPGGWLAKRIGGAGGGHIVTAAEVAPGEPGYYFQRHELGESLSLLFLADGRRAFPVGCSEQLRAPAPGGLPFLFAGVIGGLELGAEPMCRIMGAAQRLVESFGLVGLNGIDFLLRGGTCSVLEVNPRPTAAMECFDADFPDGLFACHLRACDGQLPESASRPSIRRGHAIVYASRPVTIGAGFPFPSWCRDIPQPGTRIGVGEPLCTVHRADSDAGALRRMLRQRADTIENLLLAQAA